MSLREEMWKYEQITGESAEHVPIIKLGAFLDGYEMGLKALEQQPRDCKTCTHSDKDAILPYIIQLQTDLSMMRKRLENEKDDK